MTGSPTVLTSSEARKYYDRFGSKQDAQGFYEDAALDDLIAHANFSDAGNVFEFGCGTGKFAARLFAGQLPETARYLGCDLSATMVALAEQRLAAVAERAQIIQSDGTVQFPVADWSVDRVVSNYVLDLLSEADIRAFFAEAYRVLEPGGKLCLASLTQGTTMPSRLVSTIWRAVFRMRPALVGGCRPIRLDAHVEPARWQVEHRNILTPFGVPSEVLVLRRNANGRED